MKNVSKRKQFNLMKCAYINHTLFYKEVTVVILAERAVSKTMSGCYKQCYRGGRKDVTAGVSNQKPDRQLQTNVMKLLAINTIGFRLIM
jgi:hypothetical protein